MSNINNDFRVIAWITLVGISVLQNICHWMRIVLWARLIKSLTIEKQISLLIKNEKMKKWKSKRESVLQVCRLGYECSMSVNWYKRLQSQTPYIQNAAPRTCCTRFIYTGALSLPFITEIFYPFLWRFLLTHQRNIQTLLTKLFLHDFLISNLWYDYFDILPMKCLYSLYIFITIRG